MVEWGISREEIIEILLQITVYAGVPACMNGISATRRAFQCIYLATACAITAHFAAFTFIEPLLSTALGVRATVISTLLLIFGIAGVIENFISGS